MMQKKLGVLFYILAGFGLLVSFKGLARLMGPEGDLSGGGAGVAGQMVGMFIVPILFLGLGYALRKEEQ